MSVSHSKNQLQRVTKAGIDCLVRPGAAPTIVFLHGIGSRAASFEALFAAYPPGPRLIAWDAPGYGRSRPIADDWPLARDYADVLAAALDEWGVCEVDVVGHSLGCLIAGAFGRHYQSRIRRLALLSPAVGYRVARHRPDEIPAAVAARITDLKRLGPEHLAATRAGRLVYAADAKPDVVREVREAMAALTLPAYTRAVRMLASGDLIEDARHITAPALIANGRQDVVTPPAGAERLAATFAQARLELIDCCGHALPQEAPTVVATLLDQMFGAAQ